MWRYLAGFDDEAFAPGHAPPSDEELRVAFEETDL